MSVDLSRIKNIVILMMENRSFDQMLGYLSLPPFNRGDVDGQSTEAAWLIRFTNYDQGVGLQPFLFTDPHTMPTKFDPPHERPYMSKHLGTPQNGIYPMTGFPAAIPGEISSDPAVRRLVMSYFGAKQAPMNDFFAQKFAICDRYFCSIPAGTQPNRLIAMSGFSMIEVNQTPLPEQELVYDWLTRNNVTWRVYHQGIPFFTMMLRWVEPILFDDHFRSFEDLEQDLMNTPPDQLPQVIFVEPVYGDAPHLGRSTDDHAPAGISDGQEFLMQVYNAVTNASPTFWKNAVLIVHYDENGAFFDHVSPPLIPMQPPPAATYAPFGSLGARVPAYVISPFVQPGSVSRAILDHTSVLKLIGEKFGQNGSYSSVVDARPVESISAVLNFDSPILDSPAAPNLSADYLVDRPPAPAGATVPPLNTALQKAFSDAVEQMKQKGADQNHKKFGALLSQI
ncbi:MAG TPA: alkaline phosphatase family protein [Candidatus Limnocylindrales bacterium]|nr:alkaline phosphatase family protein [Candidatus Limnocylindrales bacterium]